MKIANRKTIAVMVIMACANLFSTASSAVMIYINGEVVASPCEVNGGSDSLSVNLGDAIQADSLNTSGSATDWKDITLSLKNCPYATTSFSVAFLGTPDANDTEYYQNTGTATNLKLELTDSSSTAAYKSGATLENVAIDQTSRAYDLKMRARAVSKGAVMPGTIKGQIQATFTYQ